MLLPLAHVAPNSLLASSPGLTFSPAPPPPSGDPAATSFTLLAAPPPGWRALAHLMDFLLRAPGPDSVVHRACASLGLLPEIAWAELQPASAAADDDGATRSLELAPSALAPGEACVLRVGLADPTDREAAAFVDTLLGLVGRVYEQALELRRLSDDAHTDPLTGLWNRRGFESFLDQALARVGRSGESIAVVLCDLDSFKGINDRLGHEAGDRALAAAAQAIRDAIRPTDLAGRLGGDELAILLSGTDARGALHAAERVREHLRRVNPLAPEPVTLSMGVADTSSLGPHRRGPAARQALLRAADRALYAAKAAGRDRAVAHSLPGCTPLDDAPTAPIDL